MVIQWYPGHMTKTMRVMEKDIKLVDAIIYVLDARAPFSSLNPKFTSIVGDKPIIYVLNKSDMANDETTKEWFDYFNKKGETCILLNSVQSGSAKKIETALNNILQDKIQKLLDKSVNLIIRAMVIGVPNSGKSTLINNLSGKAKTRTGDRPGVTRGRQWVKLKSGVEVLDTPGTLWPAFDNNKVAKHLAYVGSIKEEVLDIPSLSLEFISDIIKIDKSAIKNRYDLEDIENKMPLEVLEEICQKRGFLIKGGDFDYDRGAFAIINDFKQGKLGKISLEKVSDINDLLVNDRLNDKTEKVENRKSKKYKNKK